VKINKLGILTNYKNIPEIGSSPTSIVSRNDSLGYLLFGSEIIAVDTAFNVKHNRGFDIMDFRMRIATLNAQPTFLRKNDTTFYCVGRWSNYNGSFTKDLGLLVTGLKGETKFFKTVRAVRDTNFCQALVKSVDITKDGRFVYWGGTYNIDFNDINYSSFRSSFILTKMDTANNTLWQKKYGGDAYYFMQGGVIATSDGGCLMFGKRFDYNRELKSDAYLIKVDGNGVVTSTTSIPIPQPNIVAYPNPSNGQLHFKNEDPSVSGTFEVNIFDMSGKLVFQKKETDLSENYDLNYLATGDYMYQIKQNQQIISIGKWVKIE
jgi:hypothetical protein